MNTLTTYIPGRNNYSFGFLPPYEGEKVYSIENDIKNRNLNLISYKDRMEFAREQGCNTLLIRGYGEPLLNKTYLEMVTTLNKQLKNPFINIELKTNGSNLVKENGNDFEFLNGTNIKTIVLYLTCFDDFKHYRLVTEGSSNEPTMEIKNVCEQIKNHNYNLRLQVFLTRWLEYLTLEDLMKSCKELCADQFTLCEMPEIDGKDDVNKWIQENSCKSGPTVARIKEVIPQLTSIGTTSKGYNIYSIDNMSFVFKSEDELKKEKNNNDLYLLPNAKLYRKPDDLGSLVF